MNYKIIFILLVVLVIWGFVGFWHYREGIFSKEILSLQIISKETATAGEEVEYMVKYRNNSDFTLEKPKLIFDLPNNSLTEDSKIRFVQDLKNMEPGTEDVMVFKGRLIGKENEVKVASVSLSYVPHNLSVRYESKANFKTTIDLVSITLNFEVPQSVEKGKEATYAVHYGSSIDYPLENISIKIEKSNGFNIVSANPASLDNIEWKLPILTKNQTGVIVMNGVASADGGASVTLTARFGIWQDGSFIVLKETAVTIKTTEGTAIIAPGENNPTTNN